jgi:hypothetical protein
LSPLRILPFLFVVVACRSSGSSSSSAPAIDAGPSGAFEGEIDLSVVRFSVTAQLKGNKSHYLMKRADGKVFSEMFIDGDANKLYTPVRGHKYAELSLDAAAPKSGLVAKKTGDKDTVLGHECEMLTVIDGQSRRDICLATDLPPLLINVGPMGGKGYEPSFGRGFPLRVAVVTVANMPAKMEATRIERKPIADADVTIHADWPRVPVAADAAPSDAD